MIPVRGYGRTAGTELHSALLPATYALCPRCGREMRLRTNHTAGTLFYGCRRYPACRGTLDATTE